ncbi:hypothetical protein LIP83_18975, partial [Erysipelatoclostridium ramosum]|nr:hypothetical protein [Thomasclavelia ramosa]
MTNAKSPDALRLSGLRSTCNILNLQDFVGRIRRLRRIRHLSMMPDAALVASYQAYDFLRIRH